MRLKETRGVVYIHFIISTALIVLVAGCSQSGNQSPEPERLSLQFEEEFNIGGDTSATLKSQLASPVGVRTDSEGNIYVPDRGATEIKVYDVEGNFLRSIGQEGSGPGEFGQITAIEVGNQDTLFVMDEPQRRITKFLASGEVVGSQSLQGLSWAWPRSGNFRQLPGHRYVSLRKMREIPGTTDPEKRNLQTKLIHTYHTNFKDHIDSFASLDSLGLPDHEFSVNRKPRAYCTSSIGKYLVCTGHLCRSYLPVQRGSKGMVTGSNGPGIYDTSGGYTP